MTLTDVLLEEAETTYSVTERLFRRVCDADLGWKPTSPGTEWMTTGQLLMHCARFGCGVGVRGFVTGDWGEAASTDADGAVHLPPAAALPAVASVEEALRLLAEDRVLAISWIRQADCAVLLTDRRPAPWGGAEVSLFQHLLRMIAHLAQHKGQLFYYLKLMGRDVSTVDLWAA
jgi:uncharacterized damage-inducible protein DinB